MRFALASDVHLEFGPITLENTKGADVLILSGDICVARDLAERDSYNIRGENDKSNKFHTFFQECCTNFPHVVYVMGNHEHYHGDFALTESILRTRLSYLKNLHLLEKQTVKIGDVTFIGGTLWTDMNKEDEMTLRYVGRRMNDFQIVKNTNREVSYKVPIYGKKEDGTDDYQNVVSWEFKTRPAHFSTEDAVEQHKAMVEFIRTTVEGRHDEKFVVVGHHAPSKTSTKPNYKGDYLMNGGYSSELSELILANPNIKCWTHGHTHDNFDYMIGTTRVVCNPRGYIDYEPRADYFELAYFDV